jgi:hypothetical protein
LRLFQQFHAAAFLKNQRAGTQPMTICKSPGDPAWLQRRLLEKEGRLTAANNPKPPHPQSS